MQEERIDISKFERDSQFYGSLELTTTVKNFDLQAIRARYLASKKNKNNRTGSVERREPAMGGIVQMSLSQGKISAQRILERLKEPRGIAVHGSLLAYSSENKIFLIDGNSRRILEDPWFSYIHTVTFNAAGTRLLVSSSGFDLILEYDVDSLERTYEWWAWENGFDKGMDPSTGEAVILSRKPIDHELPVRLIQDPSVDSLPTAMRAAFINSVEYGQSESNLIATLFHEGAVFKIDRETGKSERIISDLRNPHGGTELEELQLATSTRGGEVILKSDRLKTIFDFRNLPGKPEELKGEEWLQNSKMLANGHIITIDSNRTSWVIFNPEARVYDMIPYDDNLAIQDLVWHEK